MSWGYKVDSGIFSPLMENIYFRTLIATNLNDLMDQEILQCTMTNKYLGKCWGAINMISLYFAHLWLGLTHTIVFVSSEVQIEREWLIFYVTVGSPLNVCKTAHIFALFTHTHTATIFPLSIFTLWALMTVKLTFFISLRMWDYKGLYFVEVKPISDHCERLVASLEPWGSPLTLAAPESMKQTTNRRYHCTLQTTKTSSMRR